MIANHDTAAGDNTTVLLWDAARQRHGMISAIISDAGCQLSSMEEAVSNSCQPPDYIDIALIAVGDATHPISAALEVICQLKRTGKLVIAYEDGVQLWPVRCKCRPLLAGAAKLLDSASAGFVAELRQVLQQELETRAAIRGDRQQLCRLMREHGIVGESSLTMDVFRLAMRFSQLSDLPVLISGETGTGKGLLAKALHQMDPKRKKGPFVVVNCAAIQPTLLESEFFGHKRGAFTGAERDRKGLIRAAEGGVLFLDEISELDLGLQAKLLRVLQENRVLGVGEEQEVAISVRFIAATNQSLEQLVAEGRFRADLYHRLRALLIHVPPLRERRVELPILVEHFLRKHHAEQSEDAPAVSPDFLDALRQLEFPGNVRQLENVVRQSVLNHLRLGALDLADLPVDVLHQLAGQLEQSATTPPAKTQELSGTEGQPRQERMYEFAKRILESQEWNLPRALRECERHVFEVALQRTAGNQSKAARLLGITPRSVYNKLRKHRLPT